ncbi:hypothetical protein ES708_21698 [subsurface metagenome]
MPFFIQPPPPVEIPKTIMEYVESDLSEDLLDVEPELKNLHLDEDSFEHVYMKDKFFNLTSAWESKTKLHSSISKIIEDENFKKIVEMGDKAIPLIIEEIDRKPSTLVWALNLITQSSLQSNQRLTVTEACSRWAKLWRSNQNAV